MKLKQQKLTTDITHIVCLYLSFSSLFWFHSLAVSGFTSHQICKCHMTNVVRLLSDYRQHTWHTYLIPSLGSETCASGDYLNITNQSKNQDSVSAHFLMQIFLSNITLTATKMLCLSGSWNVQVGDVSDHKAKNYNSRFHLQHTAGSVQTSSHKTIHIWSL